jgi:hypothetical protein
MGLVGFAVKLAALGAGGAYCVDQYQHMQAIAEAARNARSNLKLVKTSSAKIKYEPMFPSYPWMRHLVLNREMKKQTLDQGHVHLYYRAAYSRYICTGTMWREPATVTAWRE